MGLKKFVLACVLWYSVAFVDLILGSDNEILSNSSYESIRNESIQPRRHRLQLLFPLLLRISTRLATLVPTALMALVGIFLFVVFSKKAFIISLFALYFSLFDKGKHNNEEIHIHKINSYPEYNDEEEHYHYHSLPPRFTIKPIYRPYRIQKWHNILERSLPYTNPPQNYVASDRNVESFKPLSDFKMDLGTRRDHSVFSSLIPKFEIETSRYMEISTENEELNPLTNEL